MRLRTPQDDLAQGSHNWQAWQKTTSIPSCPTCTTNTTQNRVVSEKVAWHVWNTGRHFQDSRHPYMHNQKQGDNNNMTYTTDEKRTIAELRHKSKMATLDLIAKAEGEYNRATTTHKSTLDRKIAEYELKAKNALKLDITNVLVAIRGDEVDVDGVDNDE